MSLQFDVDAENFQLYRENKRSVDVALGALILRLVNVMAGGAASGSGATATNQAANIAELKTLVGLVSTKADQDEQDALLAQIQASTDQLKNDWLAENATEQGQLDILAEITKLFNSLGYTGVGASNLNVRLQEIQLRLGNDPVVPALPDIRTLLDEIKLAITNTAGSNPANATFVSQALVKEEVNNTSSPIPFTVPADAWSVGFWLITGTCTVNGYPLRVDNALGFAVIPGSKYGVFNCSLGANSIVQVIETRP